MASVGRKPVPTASKVARGNPGKRPLPAAEPAWKGMDPTPPDWFNALELEEWNRTVPELVALGVAKAPHRGALEGICVLYGAWRDARVDVNVPAMRQAFDAYRKALNEFGLTAASSARIAAAPPPDAASAEDEFFGGPRLAG
jgi:phage terminase small subunit